MESHDPAGSIGRRIRETEKKFRLLFDNPKDVIWLMDLATRRFLYVSREIKNLLGYEPEEIIGKTAQDICTRECVEKARPIFEAEVAKFKEGLQRTLHLTNEFVTKDKSILKAEVDWRIFRDGKGLKAIGILRSPEHETELRSLAGELEAQLHQVIEERDRLRWEVKILEGLLPICASCKRIRDDDGKWQKLEKYLIEHSEADFTHTICPDCKDELYPEL